MTEFSNITQYQKYINKIYYIKKLKEENCEIIQITNKNIYNIIQSISIFKFFITYKFTEPNMEDIFLNMKNKLDNFNNTIEKNRIRQG